MDGYEKWKQTFFTSTPIKFTDGKYYYMYMYM